MVVSYDKSDLDNLLLIGSKGSDGVVVGDDKSYFDQCGSSVMNDMENDCKLVYTVQTNKYTGSNRWESTGQ